MDTIMTSTQLEQRADEPPGAAAIAALVFFAGLAAVLPLFLWLSTLS